MNDNNRLVTQDVTDEKIFNEIMNEISKPVDLSGSTDELDKEFNAFYFSRFIYGFIDNISGSFIIVCHIRYEFDENGGPDQQFFDHHKIKYIKRYDSFNDFMNKMREYDPEETIKGWLYLNNLWPNFAED